MRIPKLASFMVVLLAAVVGVQAQTEKTVVSYPTGVAGITVDTESGRAFVLVTAPFGTGGSGVQVLDSSGNVLNTYAVVDSSLNPVSGTALVYSSEAEKLYVGGVVTGGQAEVVVLRPGSGTVVATIPITTTTPGNGIVAMANDSENSKVFVANASDNVIDIIRGTTLSSIVPLNGTLATPGALGVNGDSGKIFAAITSFTDGSQQIAVVSHKTGAVTVSYVPFATSNSLVALDVDSKINREYVVDDGGGGLGTLGTLNSRGKTLATTTVGMFPQGLDVDPVAGLVFVANAADGTISKVSEGSDSVINTVSVGDAQFAAVDAKRGQVWVAGYASVTLLSEN